MAAGDTAKQQKAVFSYIASEFGLTDAILAMDKTSAKRGFTLKEAFEQIRKEKITDPNRAAEILAKTNWFKTYGVEVTKKLAQEKTGPGSFTRAVRAIESQLTDRMNAIGAQVDPADIKAMARQAYLYNLNDSQIMDKLIKAKDVTYGGTGSTGEAMQSLKSFAYGNGVSFSPEDEKLWGLQILSGDKTPADYQAALREKAAQKYTVFADQIRSGADLSDLTSAYREKMANLLEVDPDSIDWNDPLFKDGKAFTTADDKGQPAVKPLWDFEKEIKGDSRWQYTQNAHETYANAGLNVLKRFGMVA